MLHRESRLCWLALAALVVGLFMPLGTAMAQATPDDAAALAATQPLDSDDDLVPDDADNCASIANTAQIDWDEDGIGDDCDETPKGPDLDQDNDLVEDDADNCVAIGNTDQIDRDEDGIGDACDETPEGPDLDLAADLVSNTAATTSEGGVEGSPQLEAGVPPPPDTDPKFPTLDMELTVTPEKPVVPYGEEISFTITVKGTLREIDPRKDYTTPLFIEAGLTILVPYPDLPDGVNGISWRLGPHDPSCASYPNLVVGCDDTSFYPPQKDTTSATIISPTTRQSCGTITVTAQAASNNGQQVQASGSVIVGCPKVSITNQALASQVIAGNEIGFTVAAINAGGHEATGVGWSVQLPAVPGQKWTVIEQDPASPHCTMSNSTTLTCEGITVPPTGGSYPVRLTSPTSLAPESCKTYSSTATLTAGGEGSAGANVTVTCSRAVVAVTPDGATAEPGDTIAFTITVTNTSSETIDGVARLTDTLPSNSGLAWTLGQHDFASCELAAAQLECSFSDLLPGESRTVTVTSPTTTATCGPVTNSATVAPDENESSSDSGSITMDCPSPSLAREPVDARIAVGEPIGFTITATNPDETMTGATFRHALPEGFAWELTSDIEGCAIAEGTLDCTLASLEPGESIAIGITAPTSAEAHCDDSINLVTLGTQGSQDAAKVAIHCDGTGDIAPPEDVDQQERGGTQVTQLPVTGTGPGRDATGIAWLLALVGLTLCGGGVSALRARQR